MKLDLTLAGCLLLLNRVYRFTFYDRWAGNGFDSEAQKLHDDIKNRLRVAGIICDVVESIIQPVPPQPTIATGSAVNHPAHYNAGKFEVIDVIEDWGLGFNDGNALKYLARHQHKGNPVQDLEKAIWYLNRHLENLKKNAPGN